MGKVRGYAHQNRVIRFTPPPAGIAQAETIKRAIEATQAELWRAQGPRDREKIRARLEELERALSIAT